MGEILQAALLWSLKLQYVCSQICLEVGLSTQCRMPSPFFHVLELFRLQQARGTKDWDVYEDYQYI